jgi:hypothetical protein
MTTDCAVSWETTMRRNRVRKHRFNACLALAEGVCLVLALEGCANAIWTKERIGPNPDVHLGISRADVERQLGKPTSSKTLADGKIEAVYEYTVREGRKRMFGPDSPFDVSARYDVDSLEWWYAYSDLWSLGLAEFVWMPVAYFTKHKHTYEQSIVYGPQGTVERFSLERLKE